MKEDSDMKVSTIEKWYERYRKKIETAIEQHRWGEDTNTALNRIIDEIFNEGVEVGREEPYEHEHDDMRVDLD